MIHKAIPGIPVDECDDPFRLLLAPEFSSGWDDGAVRKHRQAEDATRWFFTTSLGREVLASLTWRPFAHGQEPSSLEPVGPVLRVAGDPAHKLTFLMPLHWPRRGGDGELFLLVRGWRVTPGQDPGPGEPPEAWDDSEVEWAILTRDPSKPQRCTTALLHEARAVIEQQLQDNPRWSWASE